jgi:hypothetical protein
MTEAADFYVSYTSADGPGRMDRLAADSRGLQRRPSLGTSGRGSARGENEPLMSRGVVD